MIIVWCKMHIDVLNRLGVAHECDGRTDRHANRPTDRTVVSNRPSAV